MKFKILIIDDDALVCTSLKKVLEKIGYDAETCVDASEAESKIKSYDPDIVLLDIYLTTHNGIDILKKIRRDHPDLTVIMMTGYSDVKIAVSAMKAGAYDFMLKPVEIDQLKSVLAKASEKIFLKTEVSKLQTIMQEDLLTREYFGKSKKIQKLLNSLDKLASSPDTTILIEGESGTGKEGIAKYIHQQSKRRDFPFIQINCGAIPKELAESELFGHEKGAFTGAAQKTKQGKFELAENGTIMLDEIGELSPEIQVKLLRVLQERRFYRVGGEKEVNINVRIIAATNKNLETEVEKNNFREDLFYRLNVAKITVPPLRERTDDIPLLSYSFLREFSLKTGKHISGFSPEALEILTSYNWKGNIRELRNTIERVVLFTDENEIKDHHLANLIRLPVNPENENKFFINIPPKGLKMEVILREVILKTLAIANGNQVKAARILGLSRSKLRYRMEQLGIEVTKNIQ
jgi:two-component system, NtrC family, response regulator AtoC